MICDIRVVHIRPEADGAGEILPHAFVFPDALLTFGDKRIETVFLDLLLTVQTQKLLHLQLHRKPVRIPARFPRHHTAFHGPVSGDHVLDDTGQYMSDVRLSVGCGRTVIKRIGRSVLSAFHTFAERVIFFPELFHFLLTFHKVHVCVHFVVHAS